MIVTSICCWICIFCGIILLFYGIYRDLIHRRLFKSIHKETDMKYHLSLFAPTLTGTLGKFKFSYKVEQSLFGSESGWVIKVILYHPDKLFQSDLNPSDERTINAYHNLNVKEAKIIKNKKLIIRSDGKPESKEDVLNFIHQSVLLAKSIDCSKD